MRTTWHHRPFTHLSRREARALRVQHDIRLQIAMRRLDPPR
ncbi:hypothetical protein [Nocardioides oleivorans]|nr:hypothetical protein [Nocardioides oleivorans]